jgi:hypothetical protein
MKKTTTTTTTSGRRSLLCSASLGAAAIFVPGLLFAQAPPGPIVPPDSAMPKADSTPPPPPPPRWQGKPTILGSWKFNHDDSDDARQKMQQLSQPSGNYGGRRGGGGYPGGGGGYPGGGGGGYPGGGGGGRRNPMDSYSDADKARLGDLMNPSYSLKIAQRENEVEMNDEQDRKRAFFTDGRKVEKAKDDTYHEIDAKWDDDRLVSSEDGPKNGKIERVLDPADNGMQLYETFRMKDSHSNTTLTVRYVFDRVMPPQQPAAQPAAKPAPPPPNPPQPTKP